MYPPIDTLRELARDGTYQRIPVMREILDDFITPVEALRAFAQNSDHCFLLESACADERSGRYSFLGFAPELEMSCTHGHVRIVRNVEGPSPSVEEFDAEHPGDTIRALINQHRSAQIESFPPFTGGLVGYFSYEYIAYAEPTLRDEEWNGEDFRDVDLMLFDHVVAFDSYRHRILLIAGVDTCDIESSYARAQAHIEDMYQTLIGSARKRFAPLALQGDLIPRLTPGAFERIVDQAKQHIYEGDIFQVVLSNPLSTPAEGSLFDTYRVLRSSNPSPYMFYLSGDDVEIAGSSPETLGKLTGRRLETFPLAGTRPRGASENEDAEIEAELLHDAKECAEHTMLVDLGRNDLGRISTLGSIHVEQFMTVHRYSRVMHLGSHVVSEIADGFDSIDVVDSILPAGTLSGAPKIEACKIISELEGTPRGIYGGGIGYLDFAGNMDLAIGIRLAYKKNGRVVVQSGAGIVADSDPRHEAQECRAKASAVVDALTRADGGLA